MAMANEVNLWNEREMYDSFAQFRTLASSLRDAVPSVDRFAAAYSGSEQNEGVRERWFEISIYSSCPFSSVSRVFLFWMEIRRRRRAGLVSNSNRLACSLLCLCAYLLHLCPVLYFVRWESLFRCQRSSQGPMCWQAISLKDPTSQELIECVEMERNRVNQTCNASTFYHPALGNFELQHDVGDSFCLNFSTLSI